MQVEARLSVVVPCGLRVCRAGRLEAEDTLIANPFNESSSITNVLETLPSDAVLVGGQCPTSSGLCRPDGDLLAGRAEPLSRLLRRLIDELAAADSGADMIMRASAGSGAIRNAYVHDQLRHPGGARAGLHDRNVTLIVDRGSLLFLSLRKCTANAKRKKSSDSFCREQQSRVQLAVTGSGPQALSKYARTQCAGGGGCHAVRPLVIHSPPTLNAAAANASSSNLAQLINELAPRELSSSGRQQLTQAALATPVLHINPVRSVSTMTNGRVCSMWTLNDVMESHSAQVRSAASR